MNIVFFTKTRGQIANFSIGRIWLITLGLMIALVLPASILYVGYKTGHDHAVNNPEPHIIALKSEIESQQKHVRQVITDSEEDMNALALQLGKMQAHVLRLDALGQRLTKIAKLEKGEFDFQNPPAQGGPEGSGGGQSVSVPEFMVNLQELARQLDNRAQQLGVLESMLMNRNLQAEAYPTGRPVTKGWVSSYYGMRTDPFTGKREHHKGMDFAGKTGSDVIAVAAGVVTWAGPRSGYGNLIEITHGNGYTTRYGHNKKILVKVGDKIETNVNIGQMGSSGRSTGPHVHFEVLRNGRNVDPSKYIQVSR